MTRRTSLHTCSYYCERPECIKAQRDELRDRMESVLAAPHPAITHCDKCGCDWLDNGLNPVDCPYCKQSEQAAEIGALREVLQVLVNWTPSADTYRRLGFNPEVPMRAHDAAKALLAKGNKA